MTEPERRSAPGTASLAKAARQLWDRWIWRPAPSGRPLVTRRVPGRDARAPGSPTVPTAEEGAAATAPVPEPLAGTLQLLRHVMHLIPIKF